MLFPEEMHSSGTKINVDKPWIAHIDALEQLGVLGFTSCGHKMLRAKILLIAFWCCLFYKLHSSGVYVSTTGPSRAYTLLTSPSACPAPKLLNSDAT